MGTRCILHVDLDAFYASVEQRDDPELRGRPVIVGADPKGGKGRGVVAACSYEARRFGLRSAMPIGRAFRLCPDGVYLRPRMDRYAEVSREVRKIFDAYTDLVEVISIDEAFLDVTGSRRLFGEGREIALAVKGRVRTEHGLTASVGVAPNKFIAKIASDLEKPDGLVEVRPGQEEDFLAPLPISRLWGVGRKTEPRLRDLGVATIGDLRRVPLQTLRERFGALGEHLHGLAFGRDEREVVPESEPKSVSAETTFEQDVADPPTLRRTLLALAQEVGARLRAEGLRARTATLKFRYEDFTTHTRARTLKDFTDVDAVIYESACALLEDFLPLSGRKVRLLGVGASHLEGEVSSAQLHLFSEEAAAGRPSVEVRRRASQALDRIRDRFGWESVTLGTLLKGPQRTDRRKKGGGR